MDFECLWRKALDKLSKAKEIVFIGYSLPTTDFLANWLFKTGYLLNENKGKLCIKIVDKEDKHKKLKKQCVLSKFKKIYSKEKINIYLDGFEEYANPI